MKSRISCCLNMSIRNTKSPDFQMCPVADFIAFSIRIPTVFLNSIFFRMPNAQPLPRMAQLKSPKTNRPAKNWKQINLKPSRLQLFEIAPRNASIILKHSYIFWTSLVRRKRLKTKKIWALFKRRIFHIFFFCFLLTWIDEI